MKSSQVCIASTLVWPIENDAATCAARMWIAPMGLCWLLAPIIAKVRRLDKIFNAKSLRVQTASTLSVFAGANSLTRFQHAQITDLHLSAIVATIAAPMLLICALFHGLGPLEVRRLLLPATVLNKNALLPNTADDL